MCGISGLFNTINVKINDLDKYLNVMNNLQKHRGPDGSGTWTNECNNTGFGHTRLSIIDLDSKADQPLINNNLIITFNGEIYNYNELKKEHFLNDEFLFNTKSDTEIILALYYKYNTNCLDHLNGMFSFAIYDNNTHELFCARDRLGIKPFYYLIQDNIFYFASEIKALLPFINDLQEDIEGISEYLHFNYPISNHTMFKNIKHLESGHYLQVKDGNIIIKKYWDTDYLNKNDKDEKENIDNIKKLVEDSIKLHTVSDVPISSYASGGIDSSLVSILTSKHSKLNNLFHGKFSEYSECDESKYANIVKDSINIPLITKDITSADFINNIDDIIYYLEFPIAGPGSFPQYILSKEVCKYTKVVLGGQGGDEIFGGYVRYLIPYLEKSIEEAIDGDIDNLSALLPNLKTIKQYKPMLKSFWKKGVFKDLSSRYFDIINRTDELKDIINWDVIDSSKIYNKFKTRFNNENIPQDDFFNKMLDFDLKYSLSGLLHVEDSISMAHGLESRVPLINYKIIDNVNTIPENIKINMGNMKYLLKQSAVNVLPNEILNRDDKMGFPVPLNHWFKKELKDFFIDKIRKLQKRNIDYLNITDEFISNIMELNTFSRKLWIILSLEIWYEQFFDKFNEYKDLIK